MMNLTEQAKKNMGLFETYELSNIIVEQIENQLPRGRKNKNYIRVLQANRKYFKDRQY